MIKYNRRRARRSLIDTTVFRGLSQLMTMVGYVFLVRGMSEEDFGIFNLLYAYIPAVSTFASLGLEQTLRRYQPEYLRAGNYPYAFWLVRFVASARFIANVVLIGLLMLTWNYFAPVFQIAPYKAQFALFSLLVLLHFQARVLQLSLASHMLHRFSVGSVAALSAVKLFVYALLFWKDSFTLVNAVLADTAAYAVTYVFLRVAYHKYCRSASSEKPRWPQAEERKRLFKYGAYNNFNDAGSFVLGSEADNFFIAAFIDPIAVGVYAFYSRLKRMVLHLRPGRLFDNVVQPMFFAVKQDDADKQLPRFYTLLINMDLLIQWPVLAYVTAYHGEIVQVIFGGKFIADSWLLPLMMIFPTLSIFATPATLVAQYEEKAAIILLSKIFVIYNVIALLILLPIAGIYGAAIATGSANVLKNLFIWWHVRKRAVWLNFGAVLGFGILVWGGAVGICYGLKSWLPLPSVIHLGIGIAVCAMAGLIYVRTPAIARSDRNILGSMMHGREMRLLRLVGLMPAGTRQAGGRR